ncbi:hypothetical protein H8D57_00940, partial [bacterium]|nr:hypothetical protein [bacterium]
LMRAFRCGKLTHSALNGTLRLFLNPEKLIDTHPVYSMIATPMDIIKRRAQRIARWIRKTVDLSGSSIEVQQGITQMGSGSLPGEGIPTFVVSFRSTKFTIERFAFALREATPPLFTRIADERILIDARTIADEEVRQIADCIAQAITICEKGKDLLTGYNVSEGIQIG